MTPAGWADLPHVTLGGQRIATASRADLVDAMVADCRSSPARTRLIFDANGHGLSLAARDADFRADMDAADVVHADGGFLVTASRWLAARKIVERSATTDLLHDIAKRAAGEGLSFYLLGGRENVNAACAAALMRMYPGLTIAGRRNGYFSHDEEASVVADINAARPDILWVGLGKPHEQRFCVRNRDQLRARWTITCGGCFNYVTGHYRRAPLWMQRANLEWVHRLWTRPRELLLRYAVTTPHALWLVMRG